MCLAFTLQSQSNKGGKNTLKMGFITTKSGITGKLGGCRKTQAQVSIKQCYHECKTRGTTKTFIRTHSVLTSPSSLRQEKGTNTEENPLKNQGHEQEVVCGYSYIYGHTSCRESDSCGPIAGKSFGAWEAAQDGGMAGTGAVNFVPVFWFPNLQNLVLPDIQKSQVKCCTG